jgi:hypothetical protein
MPKGHGRRGVRPTWLVRSSLVAALVAGGALLGAAPVSAAPTWLPETTLATGVSEYTPGASVDAQGDVTAAFTDNAQLVVTRHPVGGAWGAPIQVSGANNSYETPALASDAAGDTVLAFGHAGQIEAAFDPAGQAWPSPIMPADLGAGGTDPKAAIDGHGDALVLWMSSGTSNVYTSIEWSYRPAGGSWSQPQTLDDQAWSNVSPSVVFTSGGTATVVWATANGPGDQALVSADLNAGPEPSWTSPAQIATTQFYDSAQVALDAKGNATVIWSYYPGTGSDDDVAISNRVAGGQWSTPDPLGTGDYPSVAVDPEGDAAVIWQPTEVTIEASTRAGHDRGHGRPGPRTRHRPRRHGDCRLHRRPRQ